jgi:hypothetical protein
VKRQGVESKRLGAVAAWVRLLTVGSALSVAFTAGSAGFGVRAESEPTPVPEPTTPLPDPAPNPAPTPAPALTGHGL